MSTADVEVVGDRTEIERFLSAADALTDDRTPDEIATEIMERILLAKSVDEVFGPSVTHARDIVGLNLVLTGVSFNKSDFTDGPQMYGLLQMVNSLGEKVTVTCGARNVMAQAWKLQELGALPMHVVLREAANPSANGYKPMFLDRGQDDF